MNFLEPHIYQPIANTVYAAIAEQFRTALPAAAIEHIGSSAVAGAISKGDLDVYVGVKAEDFEQAISVIGELGFSVKPNTLRTKQLCPFESSHFPLEVGIQLVERGSRFEFFLTFRDLLRQDPALLERYNRFKLEAKQLDEGAYRRMKSAFIEEALATSGGGRDHGPHSDAEKFE